MITHKTIHPILLILLSLFITTTYHQTISQADFILGATYTKSFLWDNYIGVSLDYNNIQNLMNTTLFQSYHLNANIKGDWANNFAISLKTPLGHKYNCTALSANVTNPNVTCNFQTQGNKTYWGILGQFVWNTVNQPNWCIGYDMQGVNLTLPSHQDIFFKWLYQVYSATNYVLFCAEIVDYGDKMVQRGYKTSYSPANFTKDIQRANYIIYTISHSGPGITDEASTDWLLNLEAFHKVSMYGHYTVRCIVFSDPTKVTLEGILSDNATKYYLQKRFTVNQSYYYSDFSKLWLGITDIKLTTGNGVDGLTNTFAAALWAVDIALEFCIMNGWQIDFNHQVREGNFQAVLGPAPSLKPQPLYYGLIFLSIIRDGTPQIVLPSTQGMISSKIKVYGLTTGDIFKLLLLNKDTNTSLNGTVLVKSQLTGNLKCITMQAPSLTSKDGITIAGYNFVGGNATINGTFKQTTVHYNYAAEGYEVPIKYAQAVLCETADSIFNWPRGKTSTNYKYGQNAFFSVIFLAIFLTALF